MRLDRLVLIPFAAALVLPFAPAVAATQLSALDAPAGPAGDPAPARLAVPDELFSAAVALAEDDRLALPGGDSAAGADTIPVRVCKDVSICYLEVPPPAVGIAPPGLAPVSPYLAPVEMAVPEPGKSRAGLLFVPLAGALGGAWLFGPHHELPPTPPVPPGPPEPPSPPPPPPPPGVAPEPGTLLLLGTGIGVLAIYGMRRRPRSVTPPDSPRGSGSPSAE